MGGIVSSRRKRREVIGDKREDDKPEKKVLIENEPEKKKEESFEEKIASNVQKERQKKGGAPITNSDTKSEYLKRFVSDDEENVKFPVGQITSYDDIEPLLQTGDLVLMQGSSVGSKVIAMATGSRFSHVGIVIRIPKLEIAFLWESTTNLTKIADVEDMIPKKGVALVDLRSKVATLKKVSIRKLRGKRTPELKGHLLKFRNEVKDVPYEKNMIEFVRAAQFGNSKENLNSIFCSELVAEAYKRMEILVSHLPSNSFNPNDFSDMAENPEKVNFVEGYFLEKETIVDMTNFQFGGVSLEEVGNAVLQKIGKKSEYRDFDEMEPTLQTGDIVLFRTKKHTTNVDFSVTKWSHVGIVVKVSSDEHHITLVFESSVNHGSTKDLTDGKVKVGVRMVSLREKLTCGIYDKCAIRKLKIERTQGMLESLTDLQNEVRNRPYEANTLELLKAKFDWLKVLGEQHSDLSTIFCSELVAEAYQRMGLLPTHPFSNEYTPMHFAGELNLLMDAELEPLLKLFICV